jgi:hypothetical protein
LIVFTPAAADAEGAQCKGSRMSSMQSGLRRGHRLLPCTGQQLNISAPAASQLAGQSRQYQDHPSLTGMDPIQQALNLAPAAGHWSPPERQAGRHSCRAGSGCCSTAPTPHGPGEHCLKAAAAACLPAWLKSACQPPAWLRGVPGSSTTGMHPIQQPGTAATNPQPPPCQHHPACRA